MQKRGMTLVELIVAISIFIIVMTLGVGGFVTVIRSRILIGNMKDSQQKIRIANEMIIRNAKQAQYVKLDSSGQTLELYFDIDKPTNSSIKFETRLLGAGKYDLLYSKCVSPSSMSCASWGDATSLFGSTDNSLYLSNTNVFVLDGILPSVLNLELDLHNDVPGSVNLDSGMTIVNAIILEGLK